MQKLSNQNLKLIFVISSLKSGVAFEFEQLGFGLVLVASRLTLR